MINVKILGPLIQEILRQVNCMDLKDFRVAFPENADYLWDKFVHDKDSDVFEFLCYLDMHNAQCLTEWCLREIHRQKCGDKKL